MTHLNCLAFLFERGKEPERPLPVSILSLSLTPSLPLSHPLTRLIMCSCFYRYSVSLWSVGKKKAIGTVIDLKQETKEPGCFERLGSRRCLACRVRWSDRSHTRRGFGLVHRSTGPRRPAIRKRGVRPRRFAGPRGARPRRFAGPRGARPRRFAGSRAGRGGVACGVSRKASRRGAGRSGPTRSSRRPSSERTSGNQRELGFDQDETSPRDSSRNVQL